MSGLPCKFESLTGGLPLARAVELYEKVGTQALLFMRSFAHNRNYSTRFRGRVMG